MSSIALDRESVLAAVAASLLLRGLFFGVCRRYVQQFLVSDLQQVAAEDVLSPNQPESRSASHELAEIPSYSRPSFGSRPKRSEHGSDTDTPESNRERGSKVSGVDAGTSWANLLATTTFCWTFAESCTLCTLVLVANGVSEKARRLNWTLSTTCLLSIVLVLVPLLQCFMLVKRKKGVSTPVIVGTLVLFVGYQVVFNQSGMWLSNLVGIEAGSHTFGRVNSALQQICVPGVLLIAGLSGAGAVNTAWKAYEWRQSFKGSPVTQSAVLHLEQSLRRAREDRNARQRELEATQFDTSSLESSAFIARLMSSNPAQTQASALKSEISGLQSLEEQLFDEIQSMESRRRAMEMSGTLRGRLWSFIGYMFTFYCIARTLLSAISLLIGLDKASNVQEGGRTPLPTLLAGAASIIGLDIDVTTWSQLVSQGLVGVIILVNIRMVLGAVSRLFRAVNATGGAPFMLLFLSQLMAIYLLTSLISLPDSGDSGSKELLRTLPDFAVFTRLFDAVFVAAAGSVTAFRYLQRKMRAEEINSDSMV